MPPSGESPLFSFGLMFGRSAPSNVFLNSCFSKHAKAERSSHESPSHERSSRKTPSRESPNEKMLVLVSNPRLIPNNRNLSRESLN
jgi:hypothetical protein